MNKRGNIVGGIRNFLRDERAVSPILGSVLVLAVGISMLTFIQVYSVPVWNAEVEYEHIDEVYEQMMEMASDIEDVAVSGVPKSSDIQLGVEYPGRGIFYNPRPGMMGTLSVVSDNTVTINYTTLDNHRYSESYPSSSIRYTPSGTTMLPTLVNEHGVIIKDYGEHGNSTTCEQTLIVGNKVNLPIGEGTYSSSSMETGTLSIYPPTGESKTKTGLKEVWITITTNYPDIWRNLLEGKGTSETTASVVGNKIIIHSTAIKELTLPGEGAALSGITAGISTVSPEVSQGGGEPGSGGAPAGAGTQRIAEGAKGNEIEGGVRVDIPPSSGITAFYLTHITVVDHEKPEDIKFEMIDNDGKPGKWTCKIEFEDYNTIKKIELKAIYHRPDGVSKGYENFDFDANTVIDLLNRSKFTTTQGAGGMYQDANITTPNKLMVTDAGGKHKMFYFDLTVDGEVGAPTPPSPPTPPTVIASDDFESGGWNGGSGWLGRWYHEGDASITSRGDPHNGSTYHLRLRRSSGYVDRAVNLEGKSGVHLQFWAKAYSFESGEFAECLVSPDDEHWTMVEKWVDGEDDNVYRFYDIDLSSFPMTSEFWIAFDAEMSGTGDYFYVDDIRIVC